MCPPSRELANRGVWHVWNYAGVMESRGDARAQQEAESYTGFCKHQNWHTQSWAWALEMSLSWPSVFLYFWQFKENLRPVSVSQKALRLYNSNYIFHPVPGWETQMRFRNHSPEARLGSVLAFSMDLKIIQNSRILLFQGDKNHYNSLVRR